MLDRSQIFDASCGACDMHHRIRPKHAKNNKDARIQKLKVIAFSPCLNSVVVTIIFLFAGSVEQARASFWSIPSSSSPRSYTFVIGANGHTGYRVIQLLQDHPNYQPVGMVRTMEQAQAKFEPYKIPYVIGNLDADGVSPTVSDLEGCHTVIFAAGAGRQRTKLQQVTIDYLSAVRSIVNSQQTQSVRRFILLSGINTDPDGTRRSVKDRAPDDLQGPLSSWHKLKSHSETYLKECHLYDNNRSLDWTILCPSRLVDDPDGKPGTGLIKASYVHGEEDLKSTLSDDEKTASVKVFPGSHDGKMERLCISRDNTAAALVGLLYTEKETRLRELVNHKSITVIDGILPVEDAYLDLR